MKIFDLHIGLSDAATQLYKNPEKIGKPLGKYPNQFDFKRAKDGNLDIFCGVICPVQLNNDDIVLASDQQSEILSHLTFYQDQEEKKNLKIIRTQEDLLTEGLKTILGIEGIYFVYKSEDLLLLNTFINAGVKIIGPKWNFSNKLFDINNKLTNLGKEFLEICKANNIIVDLAHSESSAIEEILTNYSGKVIDSHTCIFEINNTKRNIKNEFIEEIIARKGLIGINFVGEFVGGNNLEQLKKHFGYFLDNFGIEGLSIGSDFDGMEYTDLIAGIEDVSKYESVVVMLGTLGVVDTDISKIMFENALEFFRRNTFF